MLVGPQTFDDAGVLRLDAERALIHTLDFITPISDDPARFGKIAAANALSDVYAMGGRPIAALNICCFPANEIELRLLEGILEGALAKIEEAGAALLGGHTVADAELKFGLAVTGLAHPDRLTPNSGARPGDALVLTKPIGTGVVITALRRGWIEEKDARPVFAMMEELNREAAELAAESEVRAATDITGFGLAGHLLEMAQASGVRMEIRFGALPLYRDALAFAAELGMSRAMKANRARALTQGLEGEDALEPAKRRLLFDPQTSGGLVLAVPGGEQAAKALIDRLTERGLHAAVIGRVLEHGEPGLTVLD